MSSNYNITEILSRFSSSASQLADLIGRSSSDNGVSNALENARSSLNSLRSDTRLANDVSRSFRSNPGTSSGSSTSRATLPSVTRQQRSSSSHRFAPYRQSGKRGAGREPKRFDMMLRVVDHVPELFEGTKSISNYQGQAILETAFFLTEDQTEDLVREKIMGVIRRQFQDFDGQFSYAARRNRNFLTLAADQNLDARGVRTLKGNGSVYVVLDSPATPTDEDEPEEEHVVTPQMHLSPVEVEERGRQFRRTLLNEDNSVVADSRGAISNFRAEEATSKVFRGHRETGELQLKKSSLKETGLMNLGGRRGGLVSVLCVLQWIHPIMSLVEKGSSEFIKKLQQCFAVRGSADVRVRGVLDSILSGMEITTGKDDTMEANAILDSLLRCIAENEVTAGILGKLLAGKRSTRTTLNSSQSEEITLEEDIEDSCPTMTLTIKIRSSSASSASMDDRLRDVLNENLKSNSPLPFSDWKQTWKDRYPNQHTGAEEADLCAISCQLWRDCPDCLIVGLDRTSKRGKMNTKTVLVDTDIPVEDLLKPEHETLHSMDSTSGEGYKLFALVVTAEDGRFYSCVKPEAEADKWAVYDGLKVKEFVMTDGLLRTLSGGQDHDLYTLAFYTISWSNIRKPTAPSPNKQQEALLGVGSEEDCVIIKDVVRHEEVLHRMEKAMKDFIGLETLKQQFLRFTRTQLQNDRRKRLGRQIQQDTPLHLVFAGNPGTGKTTFARRVADLLFSIKKTKKNKIVEVQRSDLIGQYLGSTTEKTKQKIVEARGGVLFIDEAYRLIPTAGGKDFGREAIEELMAVMEDGDPVMIFAGYEDKMEKFLNVNPGLRSRIYRKFTFPDYSTDELGQIFHLKAKQEGFQVDANVAEILAAHTSPAQRKNMNARLVRILFHESVEEASNRLPLNATLSQLMELKEDDVVSACARLPSVPEGDSSS